ncbi:DUF3592 domain-containing protein [Halorientalis halophila]|uniref:DUF3592 domain-containing protein n=1 Tax=Halorientalis halophila TaxID=3108499 RepID=UPI0030097C19
MGFEINGPSSPLGIALLVLGGLALVGYGGYSYVEQSSALDAAVEVNATVTSTGVEEVDKRRGVAYKPQATFEYTYEGQSHTASNVYPGPLSRDFGTEDAAREQLEGYEQEDDVTAYVAPDAPGEAFLLRERSNKPFLVIGIGLLLTLGGLYSGRNR